MMSKRGREEIISTKREMLNYMDYLISTRTSLQQQTTDCGGKITNFSKGKAMLATAEIRRLDLKIQESMHIFNLNNAQPFIVEGHASSIYSDVEFDSDRSNDDIFSSNDDSEQSDDLILTSDETDSSDEMSCTFSDDPELAETSSRVLSSSSHSDN